MESLLILLCYVFILMLVLHFLDYYSFKVIPQSGGVSARALFFYCFKIVLAIVNAVDVHVTNWEGYLSYRDFLGGVRGASLTPGSSSQDFSAGERISHKF